MDADDQVGEGDVDVEDNGNMEDEDGEDDLDDLEDEGDDDGFEGNDGEDFEDDEDDNLYQAEPLQHDFRRLCHLCRPRLLWRTPRQKTFILFYLLTSLRRTP